eukprot:66906-Pleurochrysis_carterae.AAC.1
MEHGARVSLAWVQLLDREVERKVRGHGEFPAEPDNQQANLPHHDHWYLGRLWNQRAGLRRITAVLRSALEERLRGHRMRGAVEEVLAEVLMRWEASESRLQVWEILVPTGLPFVSSA